MHDGATWPLHTLYTRCTWQVHLVYLHAVVQTNNTWCMHARSSLMPQDCQTSTPGEQQVDRTLPTENNQADAAAGPVGGSTAMRLLRHICSRATA